MKTMPWFTVAAACLLLPLLHAADTPPYEDKFETATTDSGSATSTLLWKSRNAKPIFSIAPDEEGIKSGKALVAKPGMFSAGFKEVTLEKGTSLRLTFQFRFTKAPADAGNTFRVGFFNDTDGNPEDGKDPGYWLMTNPGSATSKGMIFFEQGIDGSMGGGTDCLLVGTLFPAIDVQTTVHKLTFSVSMPEDGSNVEIKYQLDEEPPISMIDAESRLTTFNTLGINTIAGADADCAFVIDNVTLSVDKTGK